ncbi:MAG: molybdopterin-synthase adenylyltransferase MoeB [Chromatiales bacterium]|jgi:adenylyltransferase/sulfurtransferase
MDDETLLRYGRHILLPEIGIEGQERLIASRVLIVGLGGLGSPVAMYLAAGGVGRLVLADRDRVDLSNLQRQIVHRTADIGRPKVDSARDGLLALNPACRIETVPDRLEGERLIDQVAAADLVADCSDNFRTRFAVNAACARTGTPLVSGAAVRTEGQVAVFTGRPGEPCYRCLYGDEGPEEDTCAETGVLAPLVGIIGSVQAAEAIKWLAGLRQGLAGRLLALDALGMAWRSLRLASDPACPVCRTKPRDLTADRRP